MNRLLWSNKGDSGEPTDCLVTRILRWGRFLATPKASLCRGRELRSAYEVAILYNRLRVSYASESNR